MVDERNRPCGGMAVSVTLLLLLLLSFSEVNCCAAMQTNETAAQSPSATLASWSLTVATPTVSPTLIPTASQSWGTNSPTQSSAASATTSAPPSSSLSTSQTTSLSAPPTLSPTTLRSATRTASSEPSRTISQSSAPTASISTTSSAATASRTGPSPSTSASASFATATSSGGSATPTQSRGTPSISFSFTSPGTQTRSAATPTASPSRPTASPTGRTPSASARTPSASRHDWTPTPEPTRTLSASRSLSHRTESFTVSATGTRTPSRTQSPSANTASPSKLTPSATPSRGTRSSSRSPTWSHPATPTTPVTPTRTHSLSFSRSATLPLSQSVSFSTSSSAATPSWTASHSLSLSQGSVSSSAELTTSFSTTATMTLTSTGVCTTSMTVSISLSETLTASHSVSSTLTASSSDTVLLTPSATVTTSTSPSRVTVTWEATRSVLTSSWTHTGSATGEFTSSWTAASASFSRPSASSSDSISAEVTSSFSRSVPTLTLSLSIDPRREPALRFRSDSADDDGLGATLRVGALLPRRRWGLRPRSVAASFSLQGGSFNTHSHTTLETCAPACHISVDVSSLSRRPREWLRTLLANHTLHCNVSLLRLRVSPHRGLDVRSAPFDFPKALRLPASVAEACILHFTDAAPRRRFHALEGNNARPHRESHLLFHPNGVDENVALPRRLPFANMSAGDREAALKFSFEFVDERLTSEDFVPSSMEAAVVAASIIAASLAGLSPVANGPGLRVAGLLQASRCAEEPLARLAWMESPLRLSLGPQGDAQRGVVGAVIGNTLIVVAAAALLLLGAAAWALLYVGLKRKQFAAALADLRFPGILLLPFLWLLQPTVACAVAILLHDNTMGSTDAAEGGAREARSIGLAWGGTLLWGVVPAVSGVFFFACAFRATFAHLDAPLPSADGPTVPRAPRWVEFCFGNGKWVPAEQHGSERLRLKIELQRLKRVALLFSSLRPHCHAVLLGELLVSVATGVVRGFSLSDREGADCGRFLFAFASISLGYFVVTAALRPHVAPATNFLHISAAALQAVGMGLIALDEWLRAARDAAFEGEEEGSARRRVGAVLLACCAFVCSVRALLEVGVLLVAATRHHCRAALASMTDRRCVPLDAELREWRSSAAVLNAVIIRVLHCPGDAALASFFTTSVFPRQHGAALSIGSATTAPLSPPASAHEVAMEMEAAVEVWEGPPVAPARDAGSLLRSAFLAHLAVSAPMLRVPDQTSPALNFEEDHVAVTTHARDTADFPPDPRGKAAQEWNLPRAPCCRTTTTTTSTSSSSSISSCNPTSPQWSPHPTGHFGRRTFAQRRDVTRALFPKDMDEL